MIIALVQGLLFVFLLPPWQHYDEPTHFEYVWLLAHLGRPPEPADVDQEMRREVATSMLAHGSYRGLPEPDLSTTDRPIEIGYSELHHPPLYYALVSLPLFMLTDADVTAQLYAVRAGSLLLFLLIVLVTIGLVRELVPGDHPLCWGAPLCLVLLPAFVSHMTAVNNDVGAVLVVSFFLWGAVRLIQRGISIVRLLWVIGAAGLSVFTKSTAALALPFVPLVLLLALWRQQGWQWRWFGLGFTGFGLLVLVSVVTWGDAAYWYRFDWGTFTPQHPSTRWRPPGAPDGAHALRLELTPGPSNRRLLNPVLPARAKQLVGQTVTVGGWVWASEEVQVSAPSLLVSPRASTVMNLLTVPITVTTTPTFVATTYIIPDDTDRLYYTLLGQMTIRAERPVDLFVDGAFLVEGTISPNAPARLENGLLVTGTGAVPNLIRNPSFEQGGPRLRPWVEAIIGQYTERPAGYMIMGLWDVERYGTLLLRTILPHLLRDIWVAFAWGHVRLGSLWANLMSSLLIASLLGAGKWLARARLSQVRTPLPALFLLGLVLSATWLLAFIWPLPYPSSKIILPSGRYTFTAIVPLVLLLVGGWWTLWPRKVRPYALATLIATFLLISSASVLTIYRYYYLLAVP
jgi:hypothetical protein